MNWRRLLCAIAWHSWRGMYITAGWLLQECELCGRIGARRCS